MNWDREASMETQAKNQKNQTIIHRSAVVDPRAEIGTGVKIGSNTIVGPFVKIGDNTEVGPNCLIEGWTTIGKACRIFNGVVIGSEPQDLKYKGERSFVHIGESNIIREFVTIHRATGADQVTNIGSSNYIMAYAHIAHNCKIGDHVILSNAVNMAGHVTIEDHAAVSGLTAIHQFVRIGCYSYVGGGSRVSMDIVPYIKVAGNPPMVNGINSVGLQRNGFPRETLKVLKEAYRLLFRSNLNVSQAVDAIENRLQPIPEITHLVEFIKTSQRGITL